MDSNNDMIDSQKVIVDSATSSLKAKKSQPVCCSGIGSKIVTISILMIIQGALVVGKFEDNLTTDWSVIFIPVWILFFLAMLYLAFHLFDRPRTPAELGTGKLFLHRFWKVTFWIVALIFFIVLAVQLDTASVVGSTLIIIWIAYFAILLLFTILVRCANLCGVS